MPAFNSPTAVLKNGIMSTINPTLREEICTYNDRLEDALTTRVGISLTAYKSIKWTVQGIGVAGGIYAMAELGAAPITTLLIMLLMIHGPEAMEYFLVSGQE